MLLRFALFSIAACAGYISVYGIIGFENAPWGAVAGAVLALLWDGWHAQSFDAALRVAQSGTDTPAMSGWWGSLLERVRRMQRTHGQQQAASDQRLTDFLAAIQASPIGVLLLDPLNRIEWCNHIAAQQLGLDPQRDLLQHIGNLVRQPDFAAYLSAANFEHEVAFTGVNSSAKRPVNISAQLHPYGEGRKLMLTRDVTAIEQAEAQRRDFVANVSHEIRTPLTVLSGFVETLQNLPLDEAQRIRYLGLMAQQSQRMQALVSDLLTLSRLEGNPLPSMDERVTVQSLFDKCEQDAQALMQANANSAAQPLRLSFGFADDASAETVLLGAANELHSAMGNLVNNAVRYTPPGGRVDVLWTLLQDGRGQLRVTDTGPGIAPEHLPRLTERFYRVDRSRSRDTGGTGLGLAIVKHIAQRHGGGLQIDSELGKGSTFVLTLPAQRMQSLR
ncbi:MAG: phosphate regulon sensor histidine kinase PhoR [Burkholderiaceae bacterium]